MLGHLLLEDLLQNCLNAFPDPGLYVAFHVMLELALRGQAPPSSLNPQLTSNHRFPRRAESWPCGRCSRDSARPSAPLTSCRTTLSTVSCRKFGSSQYPLRKLLSLHTMTSLSSQPLNHRSLRTRDVSLDKLYLLIEFMAPSSRDRLRCVSLRSVPVVKG